MTRLPIALRAFSLRVLPGSALTPVMKAVLAALSLCAVSSAAEPLPVRDSNPLFPGADPHCALIDGTYWLYPTTGDTRLYAMSSKDLKSWNRHGPLLDLRDIPWVKADARPVAQAWAPCIAERNDKISLEQSDVISFHTYDGPEKTRQMVVGLAKQGRPILCSEYMARGAGSTFELILPVFKQYRVAAYNWGLVDGKTQTIYPWDSWEKTYTAEPEPWFHDVFRRNGAPFSAAEIQCISKLVANK